jgi:Fe-S-cluster containining protein
VSERYRLLLERLDRWAADAVRERPGVVPCRSGCAACCHGPFDISPADAALLSEGLALLPPDQRADVRARGARLLERMQLLAPGWEAPWDVDELGEEAFDEMAEALVAEPCPVLGPDGNCRAYAHRPLVCRLIGLPMLTDLGDALPNACPIQEQFPAYAALAPIPFAYEAFAAEELAILAETEGVETTIAAVAAQVDR